MGDGAQEFFDAAGISIDAELEHFSAAAIPLQWFAEADFERLRFAVGVARTLAEQAQAVYAKRQPPSGPPASTEADLNVLREGDLRSRTFQLFSPLLALILFRTARCTTRIQEDWNGPLAASQWFGRLLDLVRAAEADPELLDELFISFATAVEMGSLPLQVDQEPEERPCFRNNIRLWAKYAELLLCTLKSRGLRINGATVRSCNSMKQACGCLMLGAHPESVVVALCDSDFEVVEFLGLLGRACVAFHVNLDDLYESGCSAALNSTLPSDAGILDELLEPKGAGDERPIS